MENREGDEVAFLAHDMSVEGQWQLGRRALERIAMKSRTERAEHLGEVFTDDRQSTSLTREGMKGQS